MIRNLWWQTQFIPRRSHHFPSPFLALTTIQCYSSSNRPKHQDDLNTVKPSHQPAQQSQNERVKSSHQSPLQETQKESENSKPKPLWEKRNESLKARYPVWNPTKKLSRQAMEDVRSLQSQLPHLKTVDLANHFNISPEAIRRILRSKWIPNEQEEKSIMERRVRRKLHKKAIKTAKNEQLVQQDKGLKLGKSITLNDVVIKSQSDKSNNNKNKVKPYNYSHSFTSTEGKVRYNSQVNHGYYNKRGRKKQANSNYKPFTDSVAHMLD